MLDFIVDGYFPIVDAIEEKVLEMERYALDAFLSRAEVLRIFALRRELMRFKRVLGPMEEVASRLEHHEMPCIDWDVRPYFRDVYDHVRRVASLVEALRDVLSSVFEASSLMEQQRQGAITRRLAARAQMPQGLTPLWPSQLMRPPPSTGSASRLSPHSTRVWPSWRCSYQ